MKLFLSSLLIFALYIQCSPSSQKKEASSENTNPKVTNTKYPLSLAQWSFHKALQDSSMSNLDFAEKASSLGFTGIEYVNGFFMDKAHDQQYLNAMNKAAEKNNVDQILIMVDGEGDLAAANEKERNQAVQKHKKWVDAAVILNCKSIRVNLFGEMNDVEAWKKYATDGLSKISIYASKNKINVIVENHGWISSNAKALAEVIENVNLQNCGTLPDFGNFCLERSDRSLWGGECIREYDKYKGVDEMMPYAKAVSAKSYDFDSLGNETTIDYNKMLDIVKNHNYTGYIGVEYEGDRLSEEEGILATKALLEKLMSDE